MARMSTQTDTDRPILYRGQNRDLFYRVAEHIEEHRALYYQGSWIDDQHHLRTTKDVERLRADVEAGRYQACDSRACICGRGVLLTLDRRTLAAAFAAQVEVSRERLAECTSGEATPFDAYRVTSLEDAVVAHVFPARGWSVWSEAGAEVYGLDLDEAARLFDGDWRPQHMDVPEALRLIGDGATVEAVTYFYEPEVRKALADGRTTPES